MNKKVNVRLFKKLLVINYQMVDIMKNNFQNVTFAFKTHFKFIKHHSNDKIISIYMYIKCLLFFFHKFPHSIFSYLIVAFKKITK